MDAQQLTRVRTGHGKTLDASVRASWSSTEK